MAITKHKRFAASILSSAVLLFLIGGWSLTADFLEYNEGSESRKWLPVDGTIKTQSIRLLNRDGGVNHFAMNVTYVYHVDDQVYRGDRAAYPNEILFTMDQPELSTAKAADKLTGNTTDKGTDEPTNQSMFAKYAPDGKVTVFYKPEDKKQSTLVRGANVRRYLSQWLRDLALIVLSVGMAIWRFRRTN